MWLDVDLDAFCNRFDGDSDRRDRGVSPTEVATMHRRIASFFAELCAASWRDRIEAVSVAASPGFFPSEHWETVIPTVYDGLAEALGGFS